MTSTPSSASPMGETMNLSERRFSQSEIYVHTAFGLLMFAAICSAAFLWFDPLAVWFGRRALVSRVHTLSGLLLPVPLALGLFFSAFRRDIGLLDRMTHRDREWLFSRDRRSGRIPVGRFNAGQKLNAAFTLGSVIVLIGTGSIMGSLLMSWPADLRTGATFVHDWTAFAVVVAVVGHIRFARRYRHGGTVVPDVNSHVIPE